MPNRIIKESICTSRTIDSLSWFEEVFFYRLIVNCDDYGRFFADPSLLRSRLFPRKSITDKQINDALNKLASEGIVSTYAVEDEPYLQIVTWSKHQQVRNQKSKYPGQDQADANGNTGNDSNENQLISSDIKCPRNPIQSNPNPNPNPNISTERSIDRPVPKNGKSDSPTVITMTLNNKSEHVVTQAMVDEWAELYPAVDIIQELRKMRGWLNENPTKRKTARGIGRFIVGWLGRTQDSGGSRPASTSQTKHLKQKIKDDSEYAHETNANDAAAAWLAKQQRKEAGNE